MRSILLLFVLTCTFSFNIFSQHTGIDGTLSANPISDVIVIPVVVHVVYNNQTQNISSDQIRSQIIVLNQDYRKKNKDAAYVPASFKEFAADSRIEFRLATTDPSGLPTDGIVRKSTSVTAFGLDDKIKSSVTGGDDPWSRDQYLNLWVGNLTPGTVGYSSVPGCASEKDGVVISYTAFGTTPNVKAPFNKGRTTVHEIGHWLGLRHIWGDADCGDDRIDDTPPQAGPTRGCPSGVISTCTSGAAGNMYMNFMDFTNDECTNMFTAGQAKRMREQFLSGGARVALLSSDKAVGALAPEEIAGAAARRLELYPNPAVDKIVLRNVNSGSQIFVYNQLGQVAKKRVAVSTSIEINVADLKSGMYFVSVDGKEGLKFIRK